MVNPIQRTISSVSVMLAFEVLQVAREFRHIFWKQDYMKQSEVSEFLKIQANRVLELWGLNN